MELFDGHNRSRRPVETEELRIDFVDAPPQLDVGNVDGRLDDMRFVPARSYNDREHVLEHLPRLFFDGTGFLLSCFRVDRELPRNKKEASV